MSSETRITAAARWVDVDDATRRDVEEYIDAMVRDRTRQRPSLRELASLVEQQYDVIMSHQTVSNIINELGERSVARLAGFQKIAAEEILESIEDLLRKNDEAYRQSQQVRTKRVRERWYGKYGDEESGSDEDATTRREMEEMTESPGDPRYLAEARRLNELKAKILNVLAPTQHAHVHVSGGTAERVMDNYRASDDERSLKTVENYIRSGKARAQAAQDIREGEAEEVAEGEIIDEE